MFNDNSVITKKRLFNKNIIMPPDFLSFPSEHRYKIKGLLIQSMIYYLISVIEPLIILALIPSRVTSNTSQVKK